MNFTGRINAFRVIERLERMNILGGQNTESVNNWLKVNLFWQIKFINLYKHYQKLIVFDTEWVVFDQLLSFPIPLVNRHRHRSVNKTVMLSHKSVILRSFKPTNNFISRNNFWIFIHSLWKNIVFNWFFTMNRNELILVINLY